MNKETLFSVGADMIYLAACALHGKAPARDALARMDFEAVYKQAARHSMQAITAVAIEDGLSKNPDLAIDQTLLAKWKQDRVNSVRRTVLFDLEREKILSFFDANGIWYVPLKGLIFQNYYPKIGMRQMCDNDILFDPAYRAELRAYMEENGYEVKLFGSPYPDTYAKKPYCFEMHHALYTDTDLDRAFSAYYRDVKSRLCKDDATPARYRFTEEDFYIYCATHAYKHFTAGGTGIRSLMDIYVYLAKMEDKLDAAYLQKELETLGIAEFDAMARALSKKLFAPACLNFNDPNLLLTEEERALLLFYIGSGTYGTSEQGALSLLHSYAKHNRVTFGTKMKYCFRRLFPEMHYYKLNHPTVYKYKILIPGFLFLRACKLLFKKPRQFFKELKLLVKTK